MIILVTAAACLTAHASPQALSVERSPYFIVHIASAFLAYACFSVSFAAGLLYLIQQYQLKKKQTSLKYEK